MTRKNRLTRVLALVLCLCLTAPYLPVPGHAEGCGHVHGEECYQEVTQCVHTHGEECWSTPEAKDAGEEPDACAHVCGEDTGCVTKELNCAHTHDDTCGEQLQVEPEEEPKNEEPKPKEPKPEGPKQEEPKKEEPQEPKNEEPKQEEENQPLVISKWEWVDEEEILDPETGVLCLSAEEPILFEQVAELLPKAILATVGEGFQTIPLDHWDPQDYPQETGANSGSYRLEATLPEGYTLAEDAAPLTLHLEFAQAQALAECGHENVNMDTGKCPDCDKQVYVAKIGDTGYATLEEAVADAQKEENEGCTVTALCNLRTQSDNMWFINKGIFTLDLNERFFYDRVEVSGGELTIRNGGITESVQVHDGTLKIESGYYNASGWAVYYGGGTILISGGRFQGSACAIYTEENKPVIDLIAPGKALYRKVTVNNKEKDELVDASGTMVQGEVYVLDHIEDYKLAADGTYKCACGRTCKHTDVDMTTGKCTACQKQLYVAKIGDTGYATLGEALDAAQEMDTACTVTMLRDVTVHKTMKISKGTITLDLNGKTIDGTDLLNGYYIVLVIEGGNLTIKDSKSGGTILTIDMLLTLSSGELTIQGGMYENYGYIDANSGKLTITGGTFNGDMRECTIRIQPDVDAAISGGIFGTTYELHEAITTPDRTVADVLAPGYALFSESDGGLVDASVESLGEGRYRVDSHVDNFGPDGKCPCGRTCKHPDVDMTTGKCAACQKQVYVAKIGDTGYATLGEALDAAQKNANCTVTVLCDVDISDASYLISKGKFTLDLNGKEIKQTAKDPMSQIIGVDGCDLTITDQAQGDTPGAIYGFDGATTRAVALYSGTLTIAGGNFTVKDTVAPTAIQATGGTLKITGGTMDGFVSTASRVNVIISGGIFKYDLENRSSGEFSLSGGIFYRVIDNVFKGCVELLEPGYAFYSDAGRKNLVDASVEWLEPEYGKALYVLPHQDTYNATTGKCACGRTCAHTDVDMTTGKCNTCQKQLYVAKIGDTGYATLEEALDAAQENGNKGCTVTVLCDVREFYETIKGGKITLDLNGKKWNVGNTRFTIEGGELTLVTSKPNGKMAFKDSSICVKKGKLTVYGGEYESTVRCVIVEGGSLVISGGTFISREFAALSVGIDTHVELSGGSFSGGNKTAVADDRSAAELLAAGYAFYSDAEGNNIVDASGDTLSGTVYVLPNHPTHTYNPTTGKCDCGRTIPQATLTTAPAAAKLTYNGSDQNLVQPGVTTGGTLMYSLAENGTYTETVPTGKKADTYTVWYYVLGTPGKYYNTEKKSLTVTVGKKDLTPVVTIQDQDFDGTKEVKHFTVALEGKEDGDDLTYTLGALEFDGAIPGIRTASLTGTPELKGKDAGNYNLKAPTGLTGKIKATARYMEVPDSLPNADTVTVDGEEYPVKVEGGKRYVMLPDTGSLLTVYSFKTGSDAHTSYPEGMKVFAIDRQDTGSTLTEIPEFENLLTYEGCSIRLNGTKGIRMITSIDQAKKKTLVNSDLAGYTLVEYGTVITRESTLGGKTLNLGTGKSNYAYSRANKKDPIFKTENGRIQYTNVLVNFQPSDYKTDLVLRPYIKLRDASGNEVVLYGGTVTRSIDYIAQQNINDYKPGSAGYQYLQEILGQK